MIVDCISDLHGEWPFLKGGADLLIIAGDLCATNTEKEYDDFWRWMLYQPHEYVVIIGGNHDNFLQENPDFFPNSGGQFSYLCDSGCEINGMKIWGSPWTKTFEGMNPKCKAFTVDSDEELAEKWEMIPYDTDILITHCPPWGILDKTRRGEHVGSKSLFSIVYQINPKAIFYGHIHECGLKFTTENDILFVNCSILNEYYDNRNSYIRCQIQNSSFMGCVIQEQKM